MVNDPLYDINGSGSFKYRSAVYFKMMKSFNYFFSSISLHYSYI